jgi:hypothetical protein
MGRRETVQGLSHLSQQLTRVSLFQQGFQLLLRRHGGRRGRRREQAGKPRRPVGAQLHEGDEERQPGLAHAEPKCDGDGVHRLTEQCQGGNTLVEIQGIQVTEQPVAPHLLVNSDQLLGVDAHLDDVPVMIGS